MDGYLTKPFQSSQLYMAIRDVLAKNPSSALRAQLAVPAPRAPKDKTAEVARSRHGVLVYDRPQLLGRLRGLDNILRQMVQVFAEESPQLLAALRSALDTQEALQIQKAAHKLTGALVTVSANRAGEVARSIENAARGLELSNVEALFERLSQELGALTEAFREEGDLDGAAEPGGPSSAASS
jgi:HPt (histidine-containing phosphotransfer) domain-containing protein